MSYVPQNENVFLEYCRMAFVLLGLYLELSGIPIMMFISKYWGLENF